MRRLALASTVLFVLSIHHLAAAQESLVVRPRSAGGGDSPQATPAGAPASARPAICDSLEKDLFIDLKKVVKAGCMPSTEQIAKLLDNPVGNFVAIPIQYDYVEFEGPLTGGKRTVHQVQLLPTFPIGLGRTWSLVNRVGFPFLSVPLNKDLADCHVISPGGVVVDCPFGPGFSTDVFERTNGFGDMLYVGLVAPKAAIKIKSTGAAVIWGVGATSVFPTASEEVLGSGKYSLGPTGVFAYLGRTWTLGVFPQQWWSVGGDEDRTDVNLTNIQYFVYWAPPGGDPDAQWRIGMSPNISINWEAEGDQVTLPIGLGIGRMTALGQLPVRIDVEAEYSVIHPDDKAARTWDFRLYFTPVIPTFLF